MSERPPAPPRRPHGTRPPAGDAAHRPAAPDPPHRPGAAEGAHAPAAAYRPGADAALFRAGCPHCRESFQLAAGALRLAIGASAATTFYAFTCPRCGEQVRKPAGERIVELLTGGGVRTMRLA